MDSGMEGMNGAFGAFSDGLGAEAYGAPSSSSTSNTTSNTNDLGLAFDTSLFSSHHANSHSPSVSAAGSNGSSGSATYSPLALGASLVGGGGAPGSLPPLPSSSVGSSAFDGVGVGAGHVFDAAQAHPQYPHNSPSSLFFGTTTTPPSSSSGRGSLPNALEGRPGSSSSSRNPSRQNSNRSSWQPQPGVTADLFANANADGNTLTGSPFPVDISSYGSGGASGGGGGGSFGYGVGQAQGGHLAHHHRFHQSQSPSLYPHHSQSQSQLQFHGGASSLGGVGLTGSVIGTGGSTGGSRNWWEAKDMAPQNRKMLYVVSPSPASR